MYIMSINKLNKKSQKLLKILNIKNLNNMKLSSNILEFCDSIKYIELIVELEKMAKKKIGKKQIVKIRDIENFLK